MRKRLQAVIAFAVALVAALAVAAPAWAANDLTITVSNAQNGQTYTLYKIFDATVDSNRASQTDNSDESEVMANGINYTVPSGKSLTTTSWTSDETTVITKPGTTWFTADAAGNVRANDNIEASLITADFRNWVQQFGTEVGEQTSDGKPVVFSDLTDGYYYITSTQGSLVTVTSVAPNAIVKDKNTAPAVGKSEDVKTSSVGDTVTYTVTLSIPAGATNVIFHDCIDSEMSLQGSTIAGITPVRTGNEGVTRLVPNRDYTVDYYGNTRSNGDNITITFLSQYLQKIEGSVSLEFTYKATLLSSSKVNMKNDAYLTYGENDTESTHSTVYESTFGFTVNKLDGQNNLNGAKFVLSRNGSLGNLTEANLNEHTSDLLKFASDGTYAPDDPSANALRTANNSLVFKGLDNNNNDSNIIYYLYEVTAPDGYSKLTGPVPIRIDPVHYADGDTNAQTQVQTYQVSYLLPGATAWTSATTEDKNTVATSLDGVHNIWINNTKGTSLPSTGGAGTVAFYVIGGALMAGAVVYVVSKKRAASK